MFSVIIVNFNSGERLARCIRHLERQTIRDFEIIVFDNASSDDSIRAAHSSGQVRTVLMSPTNIGFAAANNRAAEHANGEWLVFLNPDAYAAEDWLEKLAAAAGRYPWVDAFGSLQLNADNSSVIDGAGDVLHVFGIAYRGDFGRRLPDKLSDGECFSPCAAAAMYRKSAFGALGGFDERFFCYGEDVDLGLRLRMSGGRAVQIADACVLHEGSAVSGRHSAFTVYHGHRNRIWLARKNFPSAIFWGAAPLRLATDFALIVRFLLMGEARAYLSALHDGYFGGGRIRSQQKGMRRKSVIGGREFAGLLAWSPLALVRRKAITRPIKGCLRSDGGRNMPAKTGS